MGFRLPSLLLHAGVAIALYAFLNDFGVDYCRRKSGRLSYYHIALFAALIFALHPVAVYGAGYLISAPSSWRRCLRC